VMRFLDSRAKVVEVVKKPIVWRANKVHLLEYEMKGLGTTLFFFH
jgi:hypothetical protein